MTSGNKIVLRNSFQKKKLLSKFVSRNLYLRSFDKAQLHMETIFGQKFSSCNHVSDQFLVPAIDFHINFLFLKHDFQDGVDLRNVRTDIYIDTVM